MTGVPTHIASPTIEHWLTKLRASGYRLTESRRALVEMMVTSCRPLSAQQLFDLAQAAYPDLGMATDYSNGWYRRGRTEAMIDWANRWLGGF